MKKCEPGCTCGRHRGRTACAAGCTCRRCYDNRHKYVARVRGVASEHLCTGCGQQARNWAQLKDTDGIDPHGHYQPMCLKCHRAYDGWGQVMSEHKKRYWAAVPLDERNKSEDVRSKNAEAQRRRWAEMTPEQRQALGEKVGAAQRGKPKSPEGQKNIREAVQRREERRRATKGDQNV